MHVSFVRHKHVSIVEICHTYAPCSILGTNEMVMVVSTAVQSIHNYLRDEC